MEMKQDQEEIITCVMCRDVAYFIAEETGEPLCVHCNTTNNQIRYSQDKDSNFIKITQ